MSDLATHVEFNTILSKPYTRRLTPDPSGGFVATIQEFPGLVAEGDTADEAISNLDKAAAAWLEVAVSHGQPIRDPVDFDGCSGKIALRIPRGLHKQVAELAELEECSINTFLTMAISDYVSKIDVLHKVGSVLRSSLAPVVNWQLVAKQEWQIDPGHQGPFALPATSKLMLSPVGTIGNPAPVFKEIIYG